MTFPPPIEGAWNVGGALFRSWLVSRLACSNGVLLERKEYSTLIRILIFTVVILVFGALAMFPPTRVLQTGGVIAIILALVTVFGGIVRVFTGPKKKKSR
jgi:uncharacterized membrane protein HdeD (DUF308 family)